MSLYQFRLPIRLAPTNVIDSDTDSIEIPSKRENRTFVLKIANHLKNRHSSRLYLSGSGYESTDEAGISAASACVSLKAAFALNDMGLEVPRGRQVYVQPNQPDGNVRQGDPDALIVFPQESRLTAPSIEISHAKTGPNPKGFKDSLALAFGAPLPDARVQAALDLYMAVHFQTTDRARYFQMMTVIECLSERKRLSSDVLGVYAKCKSIAEEVLSEPERNEWLSRLGSLKYESIAASCARLICERLGPDEATDFRGLYSLRSSMLHGDATQTIEMRERHDTLYRICYRLIRNHIVQ